MSRFPAYMKHADDYRDQFKPEKKKLNSAYLAGFDVFLNKDPERGAEFSMSATEKGIELQAICKSFGIEGRYPLDNEIKGGFSSAEGMANEICWANYGMLFESDCIIANVNAFRGYEPDSGTSAEIAFAIAHKKPVFLYLSDDRPIYEKVPHTQGVDEGGFLVENFNLPVNLMIACPAAYIAKSFEEAVKAAVSFHL
ncbi:nucleoside 2-deoxyribosyltransferase [Pseudomonas syringae pv. actinidiae]|nr:nucleoside 2-deoxyribosyltransferase [Pseudomonas syringae pv. actinidiae]